MGIKEAWDLGRWIGKGMWEKALEEGKLFPPP